MGICGAKQRMNKAGYQDKLHGDATGEKSPPKINLIRDSGRGPISLKHDFMRKRENRDRQTDMF